MLSVQECPRDLHAVPVPAGGDFEAGADLVRVCQCGAHHFYRLEPTAPSDSWMGWSIGHWEGDTLVIDVTSQNDKTWFDRAGNFHTSDLHVVERIRAKSLSPDV